MRGFMVVASKLIQGSDLELPLCSECGMHPQVRGPGQILVLGESHALDQIYALCLRSTLGKCHALSNNCTQSQSPS